MPKLPRITPRKLIQALLRQGFFVDHQRGSHIVLRHKTDGRITTIAMHAHDIPLGTFKAILHDIDLTADDIKTR